MSARHYWRTTPVARRWHDCTYCRSIIGPGDPYSREAIPLHVRVEVYKACCQCARVAA